MQNSLILLKRLLQPHRNVDAAAERHGAVEKAAAARAAVQRKDGGAAAALAGDSHATWVSTECGNVVAHPLQRSLLVP